jgi:tetratricopeptide (TPR) repeat protein
MSKSISVVAVIGVLLLGGCSPGKLWAWSSSRLQALAPGGDPLSKCTQKDGEEPLAASKLLETGHAYLQGSPNSENADQAIYCFNRVLRSMPQSYEAQLGLGIAFLTKAKYLSGEEPEIVDERKGLLSGARTTLGRAYSLRHGSYDPLYYLSEVALMEDELPIAQLFLDTLRGAGVKEAPVHMLLGRLREREGKAKEARAHFEQAYSLGWPSEVVAYTKEKLRLQKVDLVKTFWKARSLIKKLEVGQ